MPAPDLGSSRDRDECACRAAADAAPGAGRRGPSAAAVGPGRHRGRGGRRRGGGDQRRGGPGRAGRRRDGAGGRADPRREAGRVAAHPARRHRAGRRARLPRLLPALLHVAGGAAPDRPRARVPAPGRRLPGDLPPLAARGPHRTPHGAAAQPAGAVRALTQPRAGRPDRLRPGARPRSCSPTTGTGPPPRSTTSRRRTSSRASACPTARRRCSSRRSPGRSSATRPGSPRAS